MSHDGGARKRRRLNPPEPGAYVLRNVLEDVPLKEDEGSEDIHITCVEFWSILPASKEDSSPNTVADDNLYIGTTSSEILHFVSIPADDPTSDEGPTFIRASRLQPAGNGTPAPTAEAGGVQRILLLPGAAKACVLCNGVVSFYSLPELSPLFPNSTPSGVSWIGGIDEDDDIDNPEGNVIMIATTKKILLVRVGERLKTIKSNIEYPACLRSSRRGTIACVADRNSYALLDVEHQAKIPLFPISSSNLTSESQSTQREELRPLSDALPARIPSLVHRGASPGDTTGHGRSTSLGNLLSGSTKRQASPRADSRNRSGLLTPEVRPGSRSPAASISPERSLPPGFSGSQEQRTRPRSSTEADSTTIISNPLPPAPTVLKPHILSPSPAEFLLTTGTGEDEPGVALFVNLDGDVVRGSLEFAKYPNAVVIEKAPSSTAHMPSMGNEEDESILALMNRSEGGKVQIGIETQTLSADPAVAARSKSWLMISGEPRQIHSGMQSCLSFGDHTFTEVSELLRSVRLRLPGQSPGVSQSPPESTDSRTRASLQHVEEEKELFEAQLSRSSTDMEPPDWEAKRNKEEATFARSFSSSQSSIIVWFSNRIWRVVRNPIPLQLEATLQKARTASKSSEPANDFDTKKLFELLESIRSKDAKTEVEFVSLNYIRQKLSLILFLSLKAEQTNSSIFSDVFQKTESALIDGGLDPRVILLLFPLLKQEVLQGPQGIWLHQGLSDAIADHSESVTGGEEAASVNLLMMLKRYLTAWQGKRGFGSITDEQYVFNSVDAALLHLLLHLDQVLPANSPAAASVRAKLNNVVDHWKGDFDRAVKLLDEYKRLFVLSRLYQSKKLAKDVLLTWRRVAEGEPDAGGELSASAAEVQVRRYLVKIGNTQLVEDYGLWLATRNPELAIQVFTDDTSRVKFSPQRITPLLKNKAPKAVQQYLEYLVFSKHLSQYADDLIGYYIDSVLNVLEHSEEARDSLTKSYSTYRSLQPPKPTYLNFITQNTPPDAWWQSRLRLLQLLGGGSYAASAESAGKYLTYSIDTVLERLAPYSSFLVSESIILDARRGRHKEALSLLTHGLGDYDTAIRYCYFGGPAPTSSETVDASTLPSRTQQKDLFAYLLQEFLLIEDVAERLERTSELLGKFAAWFDPMEALARIPESWSVDVMSEFLLRTFRAITSESNESAVVKALSAAQNLQKQAEFVDLCEKLGRKVEGQEVGADEIGTIPRDVV